MFCIIILGLLIIALVILAILGTRNGWDGICYIAATVFLPIAIIFLIIYIPSSIYTNKVNYNEFVSQKQYIENHVAENEVENAALTTKKIELNSWLYSSQYNLENYSFFTLVDKRVQELDPIE